MDTRETILPVDVEKFTRLMDTLLEHPYPRRHDETAFYLYDGPECNDLFEEYARAHTGTVFFHKTPASPGGKNTGLRELFATMLESLGDESPRRREDSGHKSSRIAKLRAHAGYRMLILADIHRLVTPATGRPLLFDFHCLISYLKAEIMPYKTSVLMLGERPTTRKLIGQSAWMSTRFRFLSDELGERA